MLTSVNVGTDDANAVRIRQNRIGTKACADMYFNPNGWLYHFTYGGDGYKPNCGYAASNLHAETNTRIIGSLRVDKGTELHGTLNAHGIHNKHQYILTDWNPDKVLAMAGQFGTKMKTMGANGITFFFWIKYIQVLVLVVS